MTRPAIAYLHGFNSAPQSVKGRSIAAAAAALPDPPVFHMPYLGHRPLLAVRDLGAWIERAFSDRRAAVEFYSGAFQFAAGGGDHGWTDFGDEIASVLRFAGCAA